MIKLKSNEYSDWRRYIPTPEAIVLTGLALIINFGNPHLMSREEIDRAGKLATDTRDYGKQFKTMAEGSQKIYDKIRGYANRK